MTLSEQSKWDDKEDPREKGKDCCALLRGEEYVQYHEVGDIIVGNKGRGNEEF